MTAYDAMLEILDINESIEQLKQQNVGETPNLFSCKLSDMLKNYRELLAKELKATKLNIDLIE